MVHAQQSVGATMSTMHAPGRILVVDDDPTIVSLVERMLRRRDHQVLRCTDAAAALEVAARTPPDLAVLDVLMPGMDGFALCRRLHELDGLAEMPVVFMSALDDTDGKARAYAEGGVDYMTKPFGPDELLARVGTHLNLARTRYRLEQRERELRELLGAKSAEVISSRQELAQRNAQLSTLVATMPDLVFVKDPDGVYLECNPPLAARFGVTPEEVIGRRDEQLSDPARAVELRAWDRQVIATGAPISRQEWVEYPDGRRALLETTKTPLRAPGGNLLGVLGLARDITEHEQARQHLARSQADLLRAQQAAGLGTWTLDLVEDVLEWSEQVYRLFGVPLGEPVSLQRFLTLIHPEDRAAVHEAWQRARAGAEYRIEHRLVVDDRVRWVREQASIERDPDGRPIRALGTVLDITERKTYEQSLELEQARLRDALEAVQAATWEWRPTGEQLPGSARWAQLIGETPGALDAPVPAALVARLHPEDRTRVAEALERFLRGACERLEVEYRIRHREDRWVWLHDLGRPVEVDNDGRPLIARGIVLDITGQKAHQEQLDFAAEHDGLTGLFNRPRFAEQLHDEVQVCRREERGMVLVSLDLDGFETINRQHGRVAGNQLLIEVATRLLALVADRRHVARIGGDEFAVILPRDEDDRWRQQVDRLFDAVSDPVVLRGQTLVTTASIGVTLFPQAREVDAEQLLRQADQAVYQAKLAGKSRSHVFDTQHDQHSRERYQLIERIRAGLDDHEFVLYYQPKVNLRSGQLLGLEALIRWQHPERGLLPPGAFIPALDGHPLAIGLGDWVIEEALSQLARWNATGFVTTVSVNVDRMQLHDPHFLERLEQQLAGQPRVAAQQLGIEVLETGALQDLDHVSALVKRLQAMGVSVALDDFGTGYSSLTFLKQLTARTIKIDRSFVLDLLTDAEHAVIIDSIMGLARRFDREVVAEGVETEVHGRLLLELGCELGQGYGIARPMPSGEVADWLARWRPPDSWRVSVPLEDAHVPDVVAELTHRAWLHRLHRYLDGTAQAPPQLDPQRCRLGRWLARIAADLDRSGDARMTEVVEVHRRLHARAAELVTAHEQGWTEQRDLARQDVDRRSEELMERFAAWRQAATHPELQLRGSYTELV